MKVRVARGVLVNCAVSRMSLGSWRHRAIRERGKARRVVECAEMAASAL
jgi:hypothetical protein